MSVAEAAAEIPREWLAGLWGDLKGRLSERRSWSSTNHAQRFVFGTQDRDTAFMAYRMAHITRRAGSSHHIFRLRTPADGLAGGAIGKRVLFNIPGFLHGGPQLVAVTIGA